MQRFRALLVSGSGVSQSAGSSLVGSSRHRRTWPTHHAFSPTDSAGLRRPPSEFLRMPTRSLIVETLAQQPVRLERLSGPDNGDATPFFLSWWILPLRGIAERSVGFGYRDCCAEVG